MAEPHTHYPEDPIAKGRDVGCLTLARVIGYHIERRVFLHGGGMVMFAR